MEASTPTPQQAKSAAAGKKGMPVIAKVGIGCGAAILIAIALIVITAIVGVKVAKKQIEKMTAEYREMGFTETMQGQKLTIRGDISEQTLLLGQLVQFYGNCSTNLAIMAQVAEVHGTIEGKLHFKGQVLRITPSGRIRNGADIVAQSFVNDGTIEGEITQKTQMSVQSGEARSGPSLEPDNQP